MNILMFSAYRRSDPAFFQSGMFALELAVGLAAILAAIL